MATTRTTIAFDDDLLRRLKRRAVSEGRPVQELVNDLVRRGLAAPRGARYALELGGFAGTPRPEGRDVRPVGRRC
ncbi:MAG: CopG-like 1 or ribbon-helix-helix domain, 5 [Pseudomonadota bacterium]|jgi:hypothetical protein